MSKTIGYKHLLVNWPCFCFFLVISTLFPSPNQADEAYLEPGSLRLSHTLSLEGVFHRLKPGGVITEDSLNKLYSTTGNNDRPWKSEWGQQLLTEVATRVNKDVSARLLFEAQGEYADRFWRPININHHGHVEQEDIFIREAEAKIEKDNWYVEGFQGVGRNDWTEKGDFFEIYPSAIPQRDYLGSSGSFGIYPENWKQDQYLNISKRNVPRGIEGGLNWLGGNGSFAIGDELSWGNKDATYGRWTMPLNTSEFTFVFAEEDVPWEVFDKNATEESYGLSVLQPFEAGHVIEAGILYKPSYIGETFMVENEVGGGSGLLGTNSTISEKKASSSDAFGARARFGLASFFFNKNWFWTLDLTREEVLAGNKEEVSVGLDTEFFEVFKSYLRYTYRKPIEGPIPFIFEGTPANIGAVASNPRGPESPFHVDWTNREAAFVLATFQYDPTPTTNMFQFDPNALALWNLNPEEDSFTTYAIQYRMSDYRTTTDRQYYFDEKGDVVWEPAGNPGAFPSKHPLHEARFLGKTELGNWNIILGVAGGQAPARLGLAYINTANNQKALTEYISFEGRFENWPWGIWWHYGSGVWGPEENIHPDHGFTFDRLWGTGVTYNITDNTTWDVNYIGARQDDSLFVPPDLGSFDEIRTVFSHRFGFLFQFQGPARRGYQTR